MRAHISPSRSCSTQKPAHAAQVFAVEGKTTVQHRCTMMFQCAKCKQTCFRVHSRVHSVHPPCARRRSCFTPNWELVAFKPPNLSSTHSTRCLPPTRNYRNIQQHSLLCHMRHNPRSNQQVQLYGLRIKLLVFTSFKKWPNYSGHALILLQCEYKVKVWSIGWF